MREDLDDTEIMDLLTQAIMSGEIDFNDDDSIAAWLAVNLGLSSDEVDDVLAEITMQLDSNEDTIENTIENTAEKMSNEDDTAVAVTETDVDNDGDVDRVTIDKLSNEDDTMSEDDMDSLRSLLDNASASKDQPHEEGNSTNRIAQTLSELRL